MYTLITTVDTNDGDLYKKTYTLSDEEMEVLIKIIPKIADTLRKWSCRIEDYDYKELDERIKPLLTKKEYDFLLEYIPVPEPGYCELELMEFFVGELKRLF